MSAHGSELCAADEQQPCVCEGGASGMRSCGASSQFGACACAAADAGAPPKLPDAATPSDDAAIAATDAPRLADASSGACARTPLGSAIGVAVARGTTVGQRNTHTPPTGCAVGPGDTSPDARFAWTAPIAGAYTFDTAGSSFDTVLTVRSGACDGTSLGCNDDITAAMTASRVTVSLTAGQMVTLAVDGYAGQSGEFVINVTTDATRGDAGVDVAPNDVPRMDPCAGVHTNGRCASPTQVEFCVLSSSGPPYVEHSDCAAGERCADDPRGGAHCVPTEGCREGAVECVGTTQLRTCTAGAWSTVTCARECIHAPLSDFCGADVPTRMTTGVIDYIARAPNDPARPTDWSATTSRPTAQGFLLASRREHADGTVTYFDIVRTGVGRADGGRFTIRVPTPVTAEDSLVLLAADGNERDGITYAVADPGYAASAEHTTVGFVPPAPRLWSWRWPTSSHLEHGFLTVAESAGSGAARVFDVLQAVKGYAERQFHRAPLPIVVWLQYGTTWDCGTCTNRHPISLFGSASAAPVSFREQVWFNGSTSQVYWADAVTAHELGHWVMFSYSAPLSEGGRHMVGGHVYPGMAWSEGFATWFSSDVRGSPLYVDKSDGTMFWFDIAARRYNRYAVWTRPTPGAGLEQRIDENEVSSMLWTLRDGGASNAAIYGAFAARAMLGPTFARGYRRWRWTEIDTRGNPVDAVRTEQPAPYFADFLDALTCSGFRRSLVDAATQPSTFYPYPSDAPLCP